MHALYRLLASGRPDDQLREHRIVVERDLAAGLDTAVPPYSRSTRDVEILHAPGGREEVVREVLARDAALDCPAARHDLFLDERQSLARSDPQLPLHEVDSRDEFRDRMLHLDSSVHLEEIEISRCVKEEFTRPRVDVSRSARRGDRRRAHARAQFRRHRHARGLLDHLLVPSLH